MSHLLVGKGSSCKTEWGSSCEVGKGRTPLIDSEIHVLFL